MPEGRAALKTRGQMLAKEFAALAAQEGSLDAILRAREDYEPVPVRACGC